MTETTHSERIHIGFFGTRNAGKSSLINAITGGEISVVSDFAGTTTDLVKKTMELFPLGPVLLIDTPGIDDEGELGKLRISKTKEALNQIHIAVLVIDSSVGEREFDKDLISIFKDKNIPFIKVFNKRDLAEIKEENSYSVSTKTGDGIEELIKAISNIKPRKEEKFILKDLVEKGDLVVLVTPIDASAPRGRLILPQQQTIREILDIGAISVTCKETELKETLDSLSKKPKLVITDSQVFGFVSKILDADIPLTSFSVLFARYKGDLERLLLGISAIKNLQNGDKILISEGCTHHKQCGDIGSVKLPKWIKDFTGKNLDFSFTQGGTFPESLENFALIIHCGGCMLNDKQMIARINSAKEQNIPITNYGLTIAYINGILKRSIAPFPNIKDII